MATGTPKTRSANTVLAGIPARMKVLYVTTLHRTGGWLAEAFAADSAAHIVLEETVGITASLARLRDEMFDAVLVSHEPGVLDALEFIEGLRAGGHEEPMIVLGSLPAAQMEALVFEVGADAYCCVEQTTTRSLLWTFGRAIERHQLVRENRKHVQAERQRLAHEHREAERLLAQQRSLVQELESLCEPELNDTQSAQTQRPAVETDEHSETAMSELPAALVTHYSELLRAYVVMGTGNLSKDMARLSNLLAQGGVSAQRTMQLHLQVLEELVEGLGNRSARHVMNRADLLVLEVMMHLADGYRRRYHERLNPPYQLLLPGFETTVPLAALHAA
jgi:DNA-binding response OmpR family regulator